MTRNHLFLLHISLLKKSHNVFGQLNEINFRVKVRSIIHAIYRNESSLSIMTNEEDHNISTVSYSSNVFSKKRKKRFNKSNNNKNKNKSIKKMIKRRT